MKIIHIHFGQDGGAERFFVKLANALARRGVEQQIFIRPDRTWRREIQTCGVIHEGVFRRLSFSRFFLSARINRVVREMRPDAIISWAPRAAQAMPGNPGCIRIGRLGDYPLKLKYFGNLDIIVSNTPDITQRVKDLGWPRRAETISNFAEDRRFEPVARARFDTPDDAFLVTAMGRFVHRKGFDTLIEAVARLPDTWLWLAGDGEERAALEALVDRVGLRPRMRFLGWSDKPMPMMGAGDVFVMPSRHEPLGNVILEAWAQRLPVVSSRAEGPVWMMTDDKDGLLFDIADVDHLAACLARLRADPELCASLVRGGGETLRTRFSEDAIVDSYLALIASAQSRA